MIERQLQTAVNIILKWYDTNGHSISASKSCCVHFCRKRGIHPDPEIRIRDIQIPVVPDVRFLGVIFDRWLTFLPHILHLRKRCEKSLNLLKVLSNTSWGADRTSLLECIRQSYSLASTTDVLHTDQHAYLLCKNLTPSTIWHCESARVRFAHHRLQHFHCRSCRHLPCTSITRLHYAP
ncbi:RNA-directed DNA polymerase from mobile element jockey [Trichonephila clavipes]|nr:RNA-directed DNA polymerase from mobile element jockey [Trichonephila clavipes]